MRQHEQRAHPPKLGGLPLELVEDDGRYRWSWSGHLHSAHEFLEIRMWTPIVVGERLTFIARNAERWSLYWGQHCLDESDDIYDVQAWNGRPTYISRHGSVWEVRVGNVTVATRGEQITYAIDNNELCVYRMTASRSPELLSRSAHGQFSALGGQR